MIDCDRSKEELIKELTELRRKTRELESQGVAQQKLMELALHKCESEMTRLDRLNLIGQMAASISHEIRNPLTTVRGFLQLLRSKEKYTEDQHFFNIMIDELDRANDIITEYLGMARDKPVDLKTKSLNEIVKSIFPLIEATAINNEMNINLDLNDSPVLLLNENEIRQLVLNLARNGLDAMGPGGVLTIGTAIQESECVLYIKDQGTGIAPGLIDKLGTPFLTTKDKGTGLGLAVCYSIAARHNARVDFESGPKGTTFYARFPY